DNAVDHAMLYGWITTVFGWRTRVAIKRRKKRGGGEEDFGPNPRSLQNNPMQANGAEMMRLAACLATERGIEVCGPIHDAFIIAAPLDRLDEDVARMRACMAKASRVVCGGLELRVDAKTGGDFPAVIRYPDRYMDKRGRVMWDKVMGLLDREQARVRA
ncbi:MAG: hypothetical protein WCC64_16155, partial [Aliidongia sp.]